MLVPDSKMSAADTLSLTCRSVAVNEIFIISIALSRLSSDSVDRLCIPQLTHEWMDYSEQKFAHLPSVWRSVEIEEGSIVVSFKHEP